MRLISVLKTHLPLIAIIALAIPTQGCLLLTSFISDHSGYTFNMFHDALWHLSLIEELKRSLPPTHPGLSGIILHNYHYLSDLILSLTSQALNLYSAFVYFKIAPVIASTLFIISLYLLSHHLISHKTLALYATILAGFGGSLGWVLAFFNHTSWSANSFMFDQPFDQLSNVHTYFGFSIFLFGSYFLLKYFRTPHLPSGLLGSALLALSFGFKAYAGFIGILGLTTSLLFLALRSKKLFPLTLLLPAGIIFLVLSSLSQPAGNSLTWAPFWTLDKMVEDSNHLNLVNLVLRKQFYLSQHHYLPLLILETAKLVVFILGNLGIRTIGFIFILSWLLKPQQLKPGQVFILTATTASLALPILFRQTTTPYNIIQFGQYALILTSIATFSFISYQKKPRLLAHPLIPLAIITFSLPTTIKYLYGAYTDQIGRYHLSDSSYQALQYLKQSTPANTVVLTHPHTAHQHLMIVPGLGGRCSYYSGDTFAEIGLIDPSDRFKQQEQFFSPATPITTKKDFLANAKIDYIYLDGGYQGSLNAIQSQLPLSLVYQNQDVTIYQVNQISRP